MASPHLTTADIPGKRERRISGITCRCICSTGCNPANRSGCVTLQAHDDRRPEYVLGSRALEQSLARVEAAADADAVDHLAAAAECLWWLTALDEWHRRRVGDELYWPAREASEAGRTVAGLIYARNLVGHQLARVLGLVWKDSEVHVKHGGEWRRAQTMVKVDGEWQPARPKVAAVRWQPLADLPAPDQPERHGRDEMYRQHVEGHSPTAALRLGSEFLLEEAWQIGA